MACLRPRSSGDHWALQPGGLSLESAPRPNITGLEGTHCQEAHRFREEMGTF